MNTQNTLRQRLSGFLQSNITDKHLLIGGLLTAAGFLLQREPVPKLSLVFVFMSLVFVSNKRIRILPPAAIFISVTAMNLFRPYGSLLCSVGPLQITAGALEIGIIKASTLVGLIYVSRFFVRPTVKLPGTVGALLGNTLYYFEIITEKWRKTESDTLFDRIDTLLLELDTEATRAPSEKQSASEESLPSTQHRSSAQPQSNADSYTQNQSSDHIRSSDDPRADTSASEENLPSTGPAAGTTRAGALLLATIVAVVWSLLILSL
jgi:hypothetical protein